MTGVDITKEMMEQLTQFLDAGFDLTRHAGGSKLKVWCSQCEVVAINGRACHETGCPNAAKTKRCAAEEA